MKIVKISMELVIEDSPEFIGVSADNNTITYNTDKIADYLNDKLYTDPEFFGDFGPENILSVRNFV